MLSEKNAGPLIMYELNSLSATITQKILSVNLNKGPLTHWPLGDLNEILANKFSS